MKKQPPNLLPTRTVKQPRPAVPEPRKRTIERVAFAAALLATAVGLTFFLWPAGESPPRNGLPGSSLLADIPVQLPPTGSYADSRILPNGNIQVDHWVRTRTPITEIELVVPKGEGPGGTPQATDVGVAIDLVEESRSSVVATSAVYPLIYPSRIVRLRYTLTGAVVVSPSAPGRALARFTSADLVYVSQDGPRMVRIQAPEVLNVACREPSPGADPTPCGSPAGSSWQVRLRGADRDDEVSAQVNLSQG